MKTHLLSRVGALLIDNLALYALVLGGLMTIGVAQETAFLVASAAYLLYAVLAPTFCKGYQMGKYILGMKIVTDTYDNPSFVTCLIRELSKMMYAIPLIGIVLILVSQFLMNKREDGKTLHDLIAHTQVIRI